MSYIKKEEVTVIKTVCTHPQVSKFWEWGGSSASGKMKDCCTLILKDETRKDFEIKDNDYSEVEDYLKTISE